MLCSAVELVLNVEGQLGQIGLLTREHDLMHRGFVRWHLDGRLRIVHSPHVLTRKFTMIDTERHGQPTAPAAHGRDHLDLFRPRLTE